VWSWYRSVGSRRTTGSKRGGNEAPLGVSRAGPRNPQGSFDDACPIGRLLHFPQDGAVVTRRREELPAVAAEDRVVDDRGVLREGVDALPGRDLPQDGRRVARAGEPIAAVRGEGDRPDGVRVVERLEL